MVSFAAAANAFGRFLIGVGLLVLSFALFQLWGTSLAETKAQGDLGAEFDALLAEVDSDSQSADDSTTGGLTDDESTSGNETGREAPSGTDPDVTDEPEAPPELMLTPFVREVQADQLPEIGDASGRIVIPKLGVDKAIVHSVTRDDLRLGPGHYPSTALPGQAGNAAIAGHRTTHGSPFLDIDQLSPGDDIFVQTVQGVFQYRVQEHEDPWGHSKGHFIVDPANVDVLNDFGDNRLTLTACHPRYSAAERIIVTATLISEPAPTLTNDDGSVLETAAADGLVGEAVPDNMTAEELATAPIELSYADEPDGADATTTTAPSTTAPSTTTATAAAEDSTVAEEPPPTTTEATASSGQQRARVESEQGEATAQQPDTVAESLGWQPQHWRITAVWAGLSALVMLAASIVARRWRRLPVYGLAAAPFLYCLFWTFTHLDKMLPAV